MWKIVIVCKQKTESGFLEMGKWSYLVSETLSPSKEADISSSR